MDQIEKERLSYLISGVIHHLHSSSSTEDKATSIVRFMHDELKIEETLCGKQLIQHANTQNTELSKVVSSLTDLCQELG